MEIGLPTNVRHVAHVTFDKFHGFLGLPVEFEPEIPRRAPSARYQDDWLKTLANTLQLWEKAPLDPYALPKPVRFFTWLAAAKTKINYSVMCPDIDPLISAATDFFQQLGIESMQLSFDSRGNSVPTILLLMQRHLYAKGGLQAEGIFRELMQRTVRRSMSGNN